MNSNMYATLIMRQLGYNEDAIKYTSALQQLTTVGGLTAEEALDIPVAAGETSDAIAGRICTLINTAINVNPLLQVTCSQSLKSIHVQKYKTPLTIGRFLLSRGLICSYFSYLKYLLSNPANAFPCLASSLHISCTVSWIASYPNSFARVAMSFLPWHAPCSASTLI